jgi:uncharacterized damage-inducible protein DinB
MAFTRQDLLELHREMHGSLDVLLDHMSVVPADALAKALPGFGRASVREQFAHMLNTEWLWIRSLQELPYEPLLAGDPRESKRQVTAATIAYVNSLSDAELNTVVDRVPSYWPGPKRSPAFILLHIVTHAFHHKGQMVAMLRLLGYPAPDTDMQRG